MSDKKTTLRTDKSTEHTSDDEPEVLILPRPRFTFDKLILASSRWTSTLHEALPVTELRRCCPDLRIQPTESRDGLYQSTIQFVYKPNAEFWNLLLEHEAALQTYCISQIELAFDFAMPDEPRALLFCKDLAFSLRKLWHRRGNVEVAYDEAATPPPGIIHGPGFYFEPRTASTRLKSYTRYPKYGPRRHQPMTRLEWTLEGTENIRSKTGIQTIEQLTLFSSAAYFDRYFRLEKVDYDALGRWMLHLGRKEPRSTSLPKWAVQVVAYNMTRQELRKRRIGDEELSDFEHLEKLIFEKNQSPAVLRGLLRARRKERRPRYRDLSDHRINQFFPKLEFKFDDE